MLNPLHVQGLVILKTHGMEPAYSAVERGDVKFLLSPSRIPSGMFDANMLDTGLFPGPYSALGMSLDLAAAE